VFGLFPLFRFFGVLWYFGLEVGGSEGGKWRRFLQGCDSVALVGAGFQ